MAKPKPSPVSHNLPAPVINASSADLFTMEPSKLDALTDISMANPKDDKSCAVVIEECIAGSSLLLCSPKTQVVNLQRGIGLNSESTALLQRWCSRSHTGGYNPVPLCKLYARRLRWLIGNGRRLSTTGACVLLLQAATTQYSRCAGIKTPGKGAVR
jgi:hypothetical protein